MSTDIRVSLKICLIDRSVISARAKDNAGPLCTWLASWSKCHVDCEIKKKKRVSCLSQSKQSQWRLFAWVFPRFLPKRSLIHQNWAGTLKRKKSFRSVGEFYSSKLLKRRTWIIPNANVDFASLSVVSGKEFLYSIHRSQHLYYSLLIFSILFLFLLYDEWGGPYRLPCGNDCEIALFYSSESILAKLQISRKTYIHFDQNC